VGADVATAAGCGSTGAVTAGAAVAGAAAGGSDIAGVTGVATGAGGSGATGTVPAAPEEVTATSAFLEVVDETRGIARIGGDPVELNDGVRGVETLW